MPNVCELCKGRRLTKRIERHHLSYEPEIVIILCHTCHMLLHRYSSALENERIVLLEWIIKYEKNWKNKPRNYYQQFPSHKIFVQQYELNRRRGYRNNKTKRQPQYQSWQEYYLANKDKISKRQKKYYLKNKDKILAKRNQQYYARKELKKGVA